jgi:hypothetical protein
MNEPDAVVDAEQTPRKCRHRSRWVVFGVVLIPLLVVALYAFVWYRTRAEYEAAVAEADRLDPGWRLEELEAKQPSVPDSANATIQIVAARKLLPNPWSSGWQSLNSLKLEQITRSLSPATALSPVQWLSPATALSPAQIQAVKSALQNTERAKVEARRLANMPTARYSPPLAVPYAYVPFVLATSRFLQDDVQEIADLLAWDIVERSQAKDADGALASCQALINCGHACGAVRGSGGVLHYAIIRERVCRLVERALAQSEPAPAALLACQRILEDDEPATLFLDAARDRRAIAYTMMEWQESESRQSLQSFFIAGLSQQGRAKVFRALTDDVEIAKLPLEEREQRMREYRITSEPEWSFLLYSNLTPRYRQLNKWSADFERSTRAELRCAIAALSAERYRRTHGAWPQSFAALVPEYLAHVPLDPYDGKPLRLRRADEGIVIYSIGLDLQDDRGDIDRSNKDLPNMDRGFQLWDVARRRQQPKP